jgi:hypothetical protein
LRQLSYRNAGRELYRFILMPVIAHPAPPYYFFLCPNERQAKSANYAFIANSIQCLSVGHITKTDTSCFESLISGPSNSLALRITPFLMRRIVFCERRHEFS